MWISVKDRLPEVFVTVLGWSDANDQIEFVYYDSNISCWLEDATRCGCEITHWMSLPEPPE